MDELFVRPVNLEGEAIGPAVIIDSEGYRIRNADGEVTQIILWSSEEAKELDAARSDGEEACAPGTDWECLECGATPCSIWWCLAQAGWLASRHILATFAGSWAYLSGKDGK